MNKPKSQRCKVCGEKLKLIEFKVQDGITRWAYFCACDAMMREVMRNKVQVKHDQDHYIQRAFNP